VIYGDNDDGDDANIYRLTRRRRAVVYCRLYTFGTNKTRQEERRKRKL